MAGCDKTAEICEVKGWSRGRTCATALTGLAILSTSVAHGQPAAGPRDLLTLALPDATWAVEIQAPGFTVQTDEVSADGRRRYVYAVQQDVALSVRLERTAAPQTPEACRRYAWEHLRTRSPFRMDEVAMSRTGEVAILEYRVKELEGVPVDQLHLHGYLAKDDACVEIHVSKVRSTAADRPALAAILESARVRARGPGGRAF